MNKKSNIWIIPHKNGWAVKREGVKRISIITTSKLEADRIGHKMGKKDGVEDITQRSEGKIRSRDSYGKDPYPPKDQEHKQTIRR